MKKQKVSKEELDFFKQAYKKIQQWTKDYIKNIPFEIPEPLTKKDSDRFYQIAKKVDRAVITKAYANI